MKECCWNCVNYDTFACVCHILGKQIDHLETCDKFKSETNAEVECDGCGKMIKQLGIVISQSENLCLKCFLR